MTWFYLQRLKMTAGTRVWIGRDCTRAHMLHTWTGGIEGGGNLPSPAKKYQPPSTTTKKKKRKKGEWVRNRKDKEMERKLCYSEVLLGRALDVVGVILGNTTWGGDEAPRPSPPSQMDILSEERWC